MEYELPISKIIKAITDNGSNFIKAFHTFQDQGNDNDQDLDDDDLSEGDHDIFSIADIIEENSDGIEVRSDSIKLPVHFRCASHTINLICTSDLEKISNPLHDASLSKCQKIWNKIGRSTKAAESIKEICGVQLIRPCATRWNSLYDSISSILKQRPKLQDICDCLFITTFSTEEIEYLEEYEVCLAPLASALDKLQGDCYFGILLPTLLTVLRKLTGIQQSTEFKHCTALVGALLTGMRTRFGSILEFSDMDIAFASISHPFFKLRWIPLDKVEGLREAFIDSVLKLNELDGRCTDEILVVNSMNDNFFEFEDGSGADNGKTHGMTEHLRLQCQQYFVDPETEISMLHKYPAVKNAFLKYNTPLPSSAPVERLFSYGGMILSPNRRSLSDTQFESLLLLKVNSKYY